MAQQASLGIESAIVPAPLGPLDAGCDSSAELAFRASLPELLALPKDKLLVVNVDIQSAVCLGLAAPQRLQPWRKRILDELPRFDVNTLDRIEQYAKALMHIQVEYTLAQKGPADMGALTEATRRCYQVLMNDARALAGRGLLVPEKLAKLNGHRKRADKALALSALVSVLKAAWPRIEGKTALTLAELQQAEAQAMQLMFALAHQKRPLKDLAKISELRQRAFTAFANAYTQVRRAIQYLCANEKDADPIIPSLYPRKRAKSKPQSTTAGVTATAGTSTQPATAAPLNQPRTGTPSTQSAVTPATLAADASNETTTGSTLTLANVMSGPPVVSAPQQPSTNHAPPEAAAQRRKSKRRRRPTKHERFLRSLGITARGHGSPH